MCVFTYLSDFIKSLIKLKDIQDIKLIWERAFNLFNWKGV